MSEASTIWAWALGGLLAVAAPVLLLASAALERSGPIRLRHWLEEAGGRLRVLLDDRPRFETFRHMLAVTARFLPLLLLVFLVRPRPSGPGLSTGWALAALAIFLAAVELSSRALVQRDPERLLSRLTAIYRLVYLLALPVLAPLGRLYPAGASARREGEEEDEASVEEIEAFLTVGAQEGILDPGEEVLIQRLIDFGDARVRSVMTPRIDMVCADADTDLGELAELFLESGHSRIPLYTSSIDSIVGVLHIRDLLAALRGAQRTERPEASQIALPPLFVPASKPLDSLLRELQARGLQMAIVVDEHGGTAGLATVEDLLEEIVGEISDEHEEAEVTHQRLPDGSWRIDGRASLASLGSLFQVALPAARSYTTVGGMIFALVGKVPEPGSRVDAHGLSFTVDRVVDRRIDTVKVRRQGGE